MKSNTMKHNLLNSIKENGAILEKLIKKDILINKTVNLFYRALKNKKKILICGNGGSAADAQHLAAEMLVRLSPKKNRKPFPVLSLCTDTSTLTACSNDYGFSKIFERNLNAFGNSGDVLLAISTSGNSLNVIKAIKLAKKKKIKSVGFLGLNGGKAKRIVDIPIIVDSNNIARVQEVHIFLGHFIFQELENLLIKN